MIRPFRAEDLEDVMTLWLETNIKAHDFIGSTYWYENVTLVRETLPQAMVSVYEWNNIIKGFVGLMDGYIAGIFVSDDLQSHGIGKALLDEVKTGHNTLSLSVYKKNKRAVGFYLREGFVVQAEQHDECTGEMEWRMIWQKKASIDSGSIM